MNLNQSSLNNHKIKEAKNNLKKLFLGYLNHDFHVQEVDVVVLVELSALRLREKRLIKTANKKVRFFMMFILKYFFSNNVLS